MLKNLFFVYNKGGQAQEVKKVGITSLGEYIIIDEWFLKPFFQIFSAWEFKTAQISCI